MKKENIARFWFIMIFTAAPLYLSHGYTDITGAKTYIVWLSMAVTAAVAVFGLISGAFKKTDRRTVREEKGFGVPDPGMVLDGFVVLFAAVAAVSALLSDWRADSLTGVKAWNVGAYMIAALTAVYLIAGHTAKIEKLPLYALAAGGAAAMIIGILNDLWIDPLGAMAEVDFYWKDTFTSTIGNVNVYSGYLSIVIPVGMILFISEKNGFLKTLWGVYIFLSYASVILTHADSIYAGMVVATAIALWYCLRERKRLLWLYACGMIFAAAGAAARLLIILRPEIKMDEFSPIILTHRFDLLTGGICFILLVIHLASDLKIRRSDPEGLQDTDERALGVMRIVYLVLAAASVCAALWYVITHFGPTFLNRRGLIWQIAWSVLELEEVKETLIGLGPGNIDEISVTHTLEIFKYYGDFYSLRHAHNDIMEYLACTGILGALSYAGIYVSSVICWLKGKAVIPVRGEGSGEEEERRLVLTCAFAGAAGYMVQSVFNGPHPLTYAMFMALLALERSCVAGAGKASAADTAEDGVS